MHRLISRLTWATIFLVTSAVTLPACRSDSTSHAQETSTSTHDGSTAMPPAKSDGEFAAMMGAHHEGAIEMGRYEARHGSREDVRALGQKIADKQSEEHTRIESIARAEGYPEHKSSSKMEAHSKVDMQALRSSQGKELDRQFLVHMIDHHQQGVDMARRSLPHLKRDDLRQMAQNMIDEQTRELEQMRGMLGG